MSLSPLDAWIVVIGALCAAACALPGSLLVLRRMSMMGDAISHTVLPGIAIAFLLTNSRDPLPMFTGAVIVGVLTAVLVQSLQTFGRTEAGAAMGIVFTTLFALGIILIRQAADHVDLDPGCVLYGAIETAYVDRVNVAGLEVPRAAVINGGALMVNALLIALLYKEFKISAFDPALATTLGINARAMHYLLMTMTAATAVAAFETVGSILVIAMLIVPGATAYLLTDRLGVMIPLSAVLGAAAALLGHVGAETIPALFGKDGASTAGMMACASGALFAVAMVAAPRHGLLSRLVGRLAMSLTVVREDVLALLYRLEEIEQGPVGQLDTVATPAFIARALDVRSVIARLAARRLWTQGRVDRRLGAYTLTPAGRAAAASLVRTHRLWETYLHKHLALAADHVHPTAERLEHLTSASMQRRLDAASDRPTHDPHGRALPPPADDEKD